MKNISPTFIEYHALMGSYGRVTYFVTRTTLRDAAENLTLAPQDTLSFSERIQRVVNIKRVEKEIVPYLQNNDLRFFNAIVCILLPDSPNASSFWDFEEYKDENGDAIGGLGKLRIVKDVGRVVLDGQHRFIALQQYWKSLRDTGAVGTPIDVAVVFVVVDELGRIGKPVKRVRAQTIVAVRNLFAVLNKTARSVDKTTLLLIDDTDIFNVMTRILIEEKRIDEVFVKWTGGDNLQPRDPYFSTINVIRDACMFYLRDHAEALDVECGSDEDREALIQKFYKSTPGSEVPMCEAIPFVFQGTRPFRHWRNLLKTHRISLVSQPGSQTIDRQQGKALEDERNVSLCYTVAGQKAFLRGVLEVFAAQPRRDMRSLERVSKQAGALVEKGFLSRKTEKENPFLGLLFDARGRMSWAEGPVDLTRRIFSVALGSPADQRTILEDYRVQTDNSEEVVKAYWRRAASIRA
jgi:DGQHR domain-containing protein